MEPKEELQSIHLEARAAYDDDRVIDALRNCDWYTAALIEDVHDNEPTPERDGLGPFKDKLLGNFFIEGTRLAKEQTVFPGAINHIIQGLIGPQGHFYSLENIPFADEEVEQLAQSLDLSASYELDRGLISEVEGMLQSIIAPEQIRRKAVKATHRWGSERTKRNALLLAILTKKGARAYLESRGL